MSNQNQLSEQALQRVASYFRCCTAPTLSLWLAEADKSPELVERLKKVDAFDGAFRVVVESKPGTHVRIDAVDAARRLARDNKDRVLLYGQIGRESAQRIDVLRDIAYAVEQGEKLE